MMTYTPLAGKQALPLGMPGFSASWQIIIFAVSAIILLALVIALIIAFTPKHGARHAHGPRHAKAETTHAGSKRLGALGDGPAFPQARRPIAMETRPGNSSSNWWARV